MIEPKLRFKRDDGTEYPAWDHLPMNKVFTEIIDKNHPELPVLSIQQGVGTILRDESDRRIEYDKKNLAGYKAMKPGDFIIHLRTFEGGLECANHEGISSPAYRILRSNIINSIIYRYYFRSYNFIVGKLSVAVVGIRDGKNIDMGTFWQIVIPIPCLEEQQKIAAFLSDLDTIISASEAEVAALEQQKKGAMQKIFSQKVRFRRDDGTEYPEWEEKTLNDVCAEFKSGKNIKADLIEVEGQYAVYGGNGIRGYTNKYSHDGTYAIIGRQGALCGNVTLIAGKNYLTEHAIAVKANENNVTIFLRYLLQDMNLGQYSDQSAQPGLAVNKLIKLKNKFPAKEEQQKIADFLSSFDEAIALARQELEKWKLLKKGLMQQMFV